MGVPSVFGADSVRLDSVRLDCALVLGNRLRNVMSMMRSPDEDTRLLMRAAADDWDQFYQITNAKRAAAKQHPTP